MQNGQFLQGLMAVPKAVHTVESLILQYFTHTIQSREQANRKVSGLNPLISKVRKFTEL